jgi:hypothetical protein
MGQGFVGLLILVAALLVLAFLLTLPLRLAASAMGASRNGIGWCLLALIAASFLEAMGLALPAGGPIIAFLLSAAAFAGVLGTTFLKGIGIAALHMVFIVLLAVTAAMLGVSLAGLFML